MTKNNISNELIIETSAKLANKVGLENVSLKMIAEELNIKSPSLYNYFSNLNDIKKSLMFYGWKELENEMINAGIGVSGYEALKSMCYAFYHYTISNKGVFEAMLWYNKYDNGETRNATKRLYEAMFKIAKTLNINEDNTRHIIRTLRSFLEGFVLIINGIKSLENKKEGQQ